MARRRPAIPAAALLALAGCAAEPAFTQPASQVVVQMNVSGVVRQDNMLLAHERGDLFGCFLPARRRLQTADGPAPGPEEPANSVSGYEVSFGPIFPPGTNFTDAAVYPGGGAAFFGPQQRFDLQVMALPGQEATAGPVRLSREFRITVAAGGLVFARHVTEEELPAAGAVTLDPDMRGGRFRVRGLVQQLDHNRAPESEAINVSGGWRCPAP